MKWLSILIGAISVLGLSCSKGEREVVDPPNTVTLEMFGQGSGQTLLGKSGVYIDRSNNFHSPTSFIVDLGPTYGVGANALPKLSNLVDRAAVNIGHAYQIFDKRTVREFPSSIRAIALGVPYYRVYVDRPITSGGLTQGALVKHISIYPESYGMSVYDHVLGDVRYGGDRVEMVLPDGAECHWDSSLSDLFHITNSDGKLLITLKETPPADGAQFGDHWFYVRVRDVFASVVVSIVK